MAIIQDVLDLARVVLNDDDKVRYTDGQLRVYASNAIARAVSVRPDLWFGRFKTPPAELYAASDDFPLPSRCLQPVADYIVFRAETKDDEHVNKQRAVLALQSFDKEMMS